MDSRTSCRSVAAAALVTLLATVGAGTRGEDKMVSKKPKPLRVLFVGNSYTFVNSVPSAVAVFARHRKQRPLVGKLNAPGGCTLRKHYLKTGARKQIAEGKWDYVVLQEQSQMPVVYPKAFQHYAALLAKDIQAAGATPVFFMTWARKHIPKMQDGLTKEYTTAAKKAGGLLAPVGEAFKACRAKHPKIELYANDKSHPSPKGFYLATCVIYATLYN
ncbi:hypothetical protein LCGC14_2579120, partial [marine sediment metagenome]